MNRSLYMITMLAGIVALSFVGCGDTKSSKSERSGTEENGDGIDLNVGTDSVEFAVLPPDNSEQSSDALGLKSLEKKRAPDAIPPIVADEQPLPSVPAESPASRISVRCKNQVLISEDSSTPPPKEDILPMLPSFTIGLEEGDKASQTVSYESRTFAYACGSGGAVVSISGLSPKFQYKLDATYANAKGVATHRGEASFVINQGTSTSVKLFMKKIQVRKGSVDVEIIFDSKGKKIGCKDIDVACPAIYAPVECKGTATPFDGREIALLIGPFTGSNECTVRSRMIAEACSQEAELSPEISCKSIK